MGAVLKYVPFNDFKLSPCSVVCFLLGNFPSCECYMPTFRNTLFHLHRGIGLEFYTYPPMKMEQSVPKRRNIKFRRRGITQKKAYSIFRLVFFGFTHVSRAFDIHHLKNNGGSINP